MTAKQLRNAAIVEAVNSGRRGADVAATFGLTVSHVGWIYRRATGCDDRRRRPKRDLAKWARVVERRRAGMTFAASGRPEGLSRQRAQRIWARTEAGL